MLRGVTISFRSAGKSKPKFRVTHHPFFTSYFRRGFG
jgi:hypothetical protein